MGEPLPIPEQVIQDLGRCIEQALARVHDFEDARAPEDDSEDRHVSRGREVGQLISIILCGLIASGPRGRDAAHDMLRRLQKTQLARSARWSRMLRDFARHVQAGKR